jgi:hypothetical protein
MIHGADMLEAAAGKFLVDALVAPILVEHFTEGPPSAGPFVQ